MCTKKPFRTPNTFKAVWYPDRPSVLNGYALPLAACSAVASYPGLAEVSQASMKRVEIHRHYIAFDAPDVLPFFIGARPASDSAVVWHLSTSPA